MAAKDIKGFAPVFGSGMVGDRCVCGA